MTCAACGATIADKAIVCYRCGAPTAIPAPARKVSPPAATSDRTAVVVLVVVAIGLAGLGLWMLRGAAPGWTAARVGAYAALAAALAAVVLAGLRARRRG